MNARKPVSKVLLLAVSRACGSGDDLVSGPLRQAPPGPVSVP
jgi:hypothetical protein